MTCTVGRVQDLVVEDGEVQRQAQSDRVRRRQFGLGDVGSILNSSVVVDMVCWRGRIHLVCVVGSGSGILTLVTRGKFGQVPVVVTLPVTLVSTCAVCGSVRPTFCGRKPWTRRTRPWESELRRARPARPGKPSLIRSRSFDDTL